VTEKFNELGKTLQVKREEISLQSLFMEIEKEFEGILVGSGIQLKTELGIDRIRTDVILLKQAISNIIKNSIEAFDGVSKEAKVIEIRVREEKKRVYFEIEDNGRGMDADEVTRAFEYFFTTKPSGMGIGLSMVKRIVEALGGEIRIESTKGIGTKAEFFVGNE
jgi:signal transduction histidine kinase